MLAARNSFRHLPTLCQMRQWMLQSKTHAPEERGGKRKVDVEVPRSVAGCVADAVAACAAVQHTEAGSGEGDVVQAAASARSSQEAMRPGVKLGRQQRRVASVPKAEAKHAAVPQEEVNAREEARPQGKARPKEKAKAQPKVKAKGKAKPKPKGVSARSTGTARSKGKAHAKVAANQQQEPSSSSSDDSSSSSSSSGSSSSSSDV